MRITAANYFFLTLYKHFMEFCIKQQILKESYWEHFKYAKELALTHEINHPKRIKIETTLNSIQKLIDQKK